MTTPDSLDLAEPDPESPSAPNREYSSFREVPWQWSDAVIGLLPLVGHRLLASLVMSLDVGWQQRIQAFLLPISLFSFVWMVGFPAWIARRRGYRPGRSPGIRRLVIESGIALGAWPVMVLALGLIQVVALSLFGEASQPGKTLEPIFQSPDTNTLGLTILVVMIGPFAEEVFFRGLLYNTLRRKLAIPMALLIQAVVFASMHPFGLSAVILIGCIGLTLGLIYEWRKTLISPIVLHSLQNLVAAIVMITSAAAYNEGPMLGVVGKAQANGCQVSSVAPRSAAEVAGLKVGDVITRIDDHPIANQNQLVDLIKTYQAGTQVHIHFERDGEKREVEAVLKRRKDR